MCVGSAVLLRKREALCTFLHLLPTCALACNVANSMLADVAVVWCLSEKTWDATDFGCQWRPAVQLNLAKWYSDGAGSSDEARPDRTLHSSALKRLGSACHLYLAEKGDSWVCWNYPLSCFFCLIDHCSVESVASFSITADTCMQRWSVCGVVSAERLYLAFGIAPIVAVACDWLRFAIGTTKPSACFLPIHCNERPLVLLPPALLPREVGKAKSLEARRCLRVPKTTSSETKPLKGLYP